jgi:peroxiredoxin
MKRKLALITGTALALLLLLGLLWLGLGWSRSAPEVSFNLVEGQTLSLFDLRGRPVLITFWSVGCATCIKEMPRWIELYNELAPQGFVMIGVATPFDRPDFVMNTRQRHKLNYPIAFDLDGKVSKAFGNVHITPTTVLINPAGEIILQQPGVLDMPALRKQILSMLKQ